MAFCGFKKFFPIVPLYLILMQMDNHKKAEIIKTIPLSGAVMTLISYFLHLIPKLKEYFTVAGRLGGFFQYPNSFAIFLICGIIVLLLLFKDIRLKIAIAPILIFGVFESGSRVAFVILAIVIIDLVFIQKIM